MTPGVLLPYQQRWLKDGARVRVCVKSRRIGMSWCVAAESVLDAASADGVDTYYIGYNKDVTEEFVRDARYWCELFGSVGDLSTDFFDDEDPDKAILTYTIRFASGNRIIALSSRPTNLRGRQGHIILDEAAYHSDLKGLLKAALATLMWGGRNRVDIISTYNGVDNYFTELVEEIRAGKKPYSLHRTTIEEALEQGLFKRICLVNGWAWSQSFEDEWLQDLVTQYGDGADEELRCVPSKSGGTYLPRNLLERQMRKGDVVRFTVPDDFINWSESARTGHVTQFLKEQVQPLLEGLNKELWHGFGEDFGRTSDRTVIAVYEIAQDLTVRFPFAIELLNVPYDQQRQVLFYVVDALPRFAKGAMDATGNGGYLGEVAVLRYGASIIEAVKLTDLWYSEQLPKMKAAFNDETIEVIRDADHLLDLSAFKTINGQPKLPKLKTATTIKDAPKRHGDAGVAYLMGHYASRSAALDLGIQTSKPQKQALQQAYMYANGQDSRPVLPTGRSGFKRGSMHR